MCRMKIIAVYHHVGVGDLLKSVKKLCSNTHISTTQVVYYSPDRPVTGYSFADGLGCPCANFEALNLVCDQPSWQEKVSSAILKIIEKHECNDIIMLCSYHQIIQGMVAHNGIIMNQKQTLARIVEDPLTAIVFDIPVKSKNCPEGLPLNMFRGNELALA